MTTHTPINWHPMASNPLDYVGADLCTPDGRKVELLRPMCDFVVRVDGQEIARTNHNISVCAALNRIEAGRLV